MKNNKQQIDNDDDDNNSKHLPMAKKSNDLITGMKTTTTKALALNLIMSWTHSVCTFDSHGISDVRQKCKKTSLKL